MKAGVYNILIALMLGAGTAHKIVDHFTEKLRFSFLPVIRDYELAWSFDLLIVIELALIVLLFIRRLAVAALHGVVIYSGINLALLLYQRFMTNCTECTYHPNFTGEIINVSIILFLMLNALTLLSYRAETI